MKKQATATKDDERTPSEEMVREFHESFQKRAEPVIAKIDKRKMDAQAKAPSIVVTNGEPDD